MTGKYKIEIYDNHVAYQFEVKRNITIIQGNSGCGKTELIRLISDYNRAGTSSGITIKCDKECIALNVLDWESYLLSARNKIIFIDENNTFVKTKRFAEIVNTSDNYFVLIYRDSLPQLAYSIEEIYGMRENRDSQKYMNIRRAYNELYQLYNVKNIESIHPNLVITEDSNSGYECFSELFSCKCISSNGKSAITQKVTEAFKTHDKILAIVDGAAFGAHIQEFMRKMQTSYIECVLYAPESFEYLLLSSGIIPINEGIVNHPYDYADSKKYASWEQFFTAYLIDITNGTIYQYHKDRMNKSYLTKGNLEKIREQIPDIILL